jgi:hypothetical protein
VGSEWDNLYLLPAVLIGAAGPLIKDWLNNRAQFRLEKLRIHESSRINVYRQLLVFAGDLQNNIFPHAEDKRVKFEDAMRRHYYGKIELDQIYFSGRIHEIPDEFENQFTCLTQDTLISETYGEVEDFLNNKLYQMATELREEARKISE